MEDFQLEVLSPTGLAASQLVTEAVLPAWNGEVGILPQHVSYTAILGTGVIRYTSKDSGSGALVVSEGFCVFDDKTLKVLADRVIIPSSFVSEHGGKSQALDYIRTRSSELEANMATMSVGSDDWKDAHQEFLSLRSVALCLAPTLN